MHKAPNTTLSMTPEEILREYREAKNPNQQIKILAELNDVSKDIIISVLKQQGVDGRKLPRTKRDNASEKERRPFKLCEAKEETITPADKAEAPLEADANLSPPEEPEALNQPTAPLKAKKTAEDVSGCISDMIVSLTEKEELYRTRIEEAKAELAEIDRVLSILITAGRKVMGT